MNAFPDSDYDTCFSGPIPTANSIKALCNVAVKVTVTTGGILKWSPIVKDSYGYGGPWPYVNLTLMNCKDHNASGLFRTAAQSAATIMFYDDITGPLSNLTRKSATEVSLSLGSLYSYRGPSVPCIYNYTVVSGCVLGAKPPPKVPVCPAGYILKTGAASTKYCSPCPPGTSSPGPNSPSCTPCAAGTYSPNYGGRCKGCPGDGYAPQAGTSQCEYCYREYDNKWSDGKRCESCPAGSFWSPAVRSQCIKCVAGKKCCTVNWTSPSGSCPKCAAGPGSSAAPLTSIFALYTASSAACLATAHARCAPKINVTIDSTCSISLATLSGYAAPVGRYQECDWQASTPIQGAKVNALVDLAQFPNWDHSDYSLLAGNLTAASSSTLTFRIPSTKCVLKYRALTKPAAALLGVAPKPCPLGTPGCPSKASNCPAGRYLETASAARPAPCVRCPPGTFSNKASSGAPCTPCPPGTYARNYGSTKCARCAAGLIAKERSAVCTPCEESSSYQSSASACTHCPANAVTYYPHLTSCLGNAYGNVCCAAGKCGGQPRCPSTLPSSQDDFKPYPAVMQLVKKALPLPACKSATVLRCLQDNALVELLTDSLSPSSLYLYLIQAPKCVEAGPNGYPFYISGAYTSATHAYVQGSAAGVNFGYVLVSDKAQGTITAHLSKYLDYDQVTDTPALHGPCSATFKLVAGHAFDLSPPAGAKCPSNAIPSTVNGRTFCEFCQAGSYKNATGACASCPGGQYQNLLGATVCKPCPAGTSCYPGTSFPEPCPPGSYSAKAAAGACTPCPKNTFASGVGAKKCAKCPSLTRSAPGSQVCGVFW